MLNVPLFPDRAQHCITLAFDFCGISSLTVKQAGRQTNVQLIVILFKIKWYVTLYFGVHSNI